jgi:hypothetical protein
LQMPDDRTAVPIICKKPTEVLVMIPRWMEVPPKENIYQDPLDRIK